MRATMSQIISCQAARPTDHSVKGPKGTGISRLRPNSSAGDLKEWMPKLAKWRVEAIIDLHGQQRQIDLRGRIDTEIEALPEPVRTIAKSKRVYVTEYSRTDQLFDLIGSAIAMSPEEIDALWLEASLL